MSDHQVSAFADELRRLRLERGLSYRGLAGVAHYGKSYLEDLEKGRKLPSPALAGRLDDILHAGGRLTATLRTPAPAMRRESVSVRVGWICLLVVGIGILAFGLVAVLAPGHDDRPLMRADGLASTGLGLFGVLMAAIPFRRGERWAWYAFWFYPVFWTVHLVGRLPPGNDHVHQIVFIVLSLTGLLVTVGWFFPRRGDRDEGPGALGPPSVSP
jgi:transcriptional regulator with XRE-family HTH domain